MRCADLREQRSRTGDHERDREVSGVELERDRAETQKGIAAGGEHADVVDKHEDRTLSARLTLGEPGTRSSVIPMGAGRA